MNSSQENNFNMAGEKKPQEFNSFINTQPPPYSAPQTTSQGVVIGQPQFLNNKPPLFPPLFGIYKNGIKHLALAASKSAPPFMALAIHSGFSGSPSLVLTVPDSSTIGTADFHSFSAKTDIVVGGQSCVLQSEGFMATAFVFEYVHDDGRREVFEWKRSHGPEVKGLQGSSAGMKCVRRGTGQVVAAWARPSGMSMDKLAKIGLIERGLGERWEVTVVVSALALVERERRRRASASAGGGGGA